MTPAQRKYYDTFMEIKGELDELIPPKHVTPYRAIQIRHDFIEAAKKAKNMKEFLQSTGRLIKASFVRKADDTEYGDVKGTLKNLAGDEYRELPVYFTRPLPKEDMKDLSLDSAGTLMAYASMAYTYSALDEVKDSLELGLSRLKETRIKEYDGLLKKVARFSLFGEKYQEDVTKRGEDSNIYKQLNNFMESRVYQRYYKDEGA
jgi:hypothetical protein